MALYRATIQPLGPLASPLQSDTLFGAFCWSWLRLHGAEDLKEEIIDFSLIGEPPVVFSNGFPHDGLPLPFGCYDRAAGFQRSTEKRERLRAYQRNKKLKGARYVSRQAFLRIKAGEWEGFTDELAAEAGSEETTIHNMVSRESGTVENIDGAGNLFGSDRRFFSHEQKFDIYILNELPFEQMREALELMLDLGIGADKSCGCGSFRLLTLEEEEELQKIPPGANGFAALSNFLPAAGDPIEGWYQTLAKYPRLDREMASGDAPFKRPMLMLKAGSMFLTEKPQLRYGRCVTGIAAVPEPVTANCCTIAVPMTIPKEALAEGRP